MFQYVFVVHVAGLAPRMASTMSKEGSAWGAQGEVRTEESWACLSASSIYEWSTKIAIHPTLVFNGSF